MSIGNALLWTLVITGGIWLLIPGGLVEWWEYLIVPFVILGRIFLNRFAMGGILLLVIAFIPLSIRLYSRKHFKRVYEWCKRMIRMAATAVRAMWFKLHWSIRALISFVPFVILAAGMFAAGGVLGAIAWLQPVVASNAIRALVLPWLAKKAAGTGVQRLFPAIWGLLPNSIRQEIFQRYRRLWWRTIHKLLKGRQMLGKKAQALQRGWEFGFRYNPLP